MKISLLSALALATVALGAAAPLKSVIVSYPEGTPESVLAQAKDAIRAAGGVIVHEYDIIKGFAANAPAKVLETVQTWGKEYQAVIEEDQMVNIVGARGS